MNREVHARFWEQPEVKFLRLTRLDHRSGGLQQIARRHFVGPLALVAIVPWQIDLLSSEEACKCWVG